MNRDGKLKSLWQQVEAYTPKPEPNHHQDFDVIIIGAGITGLSTALRLQQRGLKCIIAEANSIGFGTSGGTTAHLNTFVDTTYKEIISKFSEEKAKLVYKATETAINLIKENVTNCGISCALQEKNAYLFSVNEDQNKILEDIIEGGKKVGLNINGAAENPFPIPYKKVAVIEKQAQFNPADYLKGLAEAFENLNGIILEHCRVKEIKEDEPLLIETDKFQLRARYAVYATHIPPGINVLHFRCAPYRSYAMAVTLNEGADYPDFLGYDLNDPYHYYRTQVVNGNKFLIAGGEDHKTGHEENTIIPFRELESHVRSHFDVKQINYHWSSQYFEPADGLPYIGNLPGKPANIFVATGFGGNGMIYGSITAILLADLIATGDSEYRELFDPNRLKPLAGFRNFMKEGADVVKEFIKGKWSVSKISEIAALAPGEGRVIKMDGQSAAVYKDDNHNIFALNPSCPHTHCNVNWNHSERSWDCPCHGSRFSSEGYLLTAPATDNLKKIELLR
jgi:glycine/D-amino acid oxidase-like deaminating enzyme/nitrite reductase/ring-hydroxylating ferredoxin subunit